MKLFFIRHGETYLNKYNRMQGWSDSFLTPTGIAGLEIAGKQLKQVNFNKVYTSDSSRAIESMEIILKNLENKEVLPVESSMFFREQFFGGFEGTNSDKTWLKISQLLGFKSIDDMFINATKKDIMNTMNKIDQYEDAETYEEFWTRINKGLEQVIFENPSDSNILIVTHGGYIRNIIDRYVPSHKKNFELKNASITKITIDTESVLNFSKLY